ncbi:hypothetical protein BC938DRAFT_481162 [Jimgerdemannia flammicorona]|uniref:Protein kinase domain-containing protein n=1 Tax=Jimgerdemannia flammicorona TaxID=994334 RepID=A0A433QGX8_9FUNG|nr:hypothetical protein BC938DRAFT_481162 [Jimgerdemannia flammicorona]
MTSVFKLLDLTFAFAGVGLTARLKFAMGRCLIFGAKFWRRFEFPCSIIIIPDIPQQSPRHLLRVTARGAHPGVPAQSVDVLRRYWNLDPAQRPDMGQVLEDLCMPGDRRVQWSCEWSTEL